MSGAAGSVKNANTISIRLQISHEMTSSGLRMSSEIGRGLTNVNLNKCPQCIVQEIDDVTTSSWNVEIGKKFRGGERFSYYIGLMAGKTVENYYLLFLKL